MPTRATRLPKYRHYRPKDLGVVRLDGRDVYLGKYDSPESREKYRRVVGEWLATGLSPCERSDRPAEEAVGPTVSELILAFLRHADRYYRRADGAPTGEVENFRYALRPLRRLYGGTAARSFGPRSLKAVREEMVASGACRSLINSRVARIVRVFRWATENELIPADVHHALRAVEGLKKNRTAAREPAPVRPVAPESVEAVRPHVARQVWAMIELQALTGMRPGEVAIMRSGDVDRSAEVWAYTPARHKVEHHGKVRTIFFGPRAQAVLRPWLRESPDEYLFQPREAAEERWAARRSGRRSPMTPSQRARARKAKPGRAPGPLYSTRAYTHAIHGGCRKAGVEVWGANRLRHNTATAIRRAFDLETARAVLGHEDVDSTLIYAELDQAKARRVMAEIG